MSELVSVVKECLTDAIWYWEWRRIAFNVILSIETLGIYLNAVPVCSIKASFSVGFVAVFVIAAVLANILYCFAYVPDLAFQLSGFREHWRRWRWLLFAGGTLFAMLLAYLAVHDVVLFQPGE